MPLTTIHIRNMCCQRCVDAVTDELLKLNVNIEEVKLGSASFKPSRSFNPAEMESALNKRGFALVKNEEEGVIENIKAAILELVNRLTDTNMKDLHLSSYLENRTKTPYRQLLEVFKKRVGSTIQKYFIRQKIEKVKDLLENSDTQLSVIADSMGYKSVQHLSGQFKSITGKTMQQYKRSRIKKRVFVDRI